MDRPPRAICPQKTGVMCISFRGYSHASAPVILRLTLLRPLMIAFSAFGLASEGPSPDSDPSSRPYQLGAWTRWRVQFLHSEVNPYRSHLPLPPPSESSYAIVCSPLAGRLGSPPSPWCCWIVPRRGSAQYVKSQPVPRCHERSQPPSINGCSSRCQHRPRGVPTQSLGATLHARSPFFFSPFLLLCSEPALSRRGPHTLLNGRSDHSRCV